MRICSEPEDLELRMMKKKELRMMELKTMLLSRNYNNNVKNAAHIKSFLDKVNLTD